MQCILGREGGEAERREEVHGLGVEIPLSEEPFSSAECTVGRRSG